MPRVLSALLVLGACGSSASPPAGPLGGSLLVEGAVHDFKTGDRISGDAVVSTSGLIPAPSIETMGAGFVLDGVPENSVFHVLAGVPPTHRATFGPAIEVTADDRSDIVVPAVEEAFIGQLATAFGVTPSSTRGIVLARIVRDDGYARAGLPASALSIEGGADVKGPYFLDHAINAAPTLTMTSTSAWVVYFDVAPGVVGLEGAANANVTIDMPISPVAANAVSVVIAKASDGMVVAPTNVSFATQVFPIFRSRGCVACHEAGNGPGRDLGNLTLNMDPMLVYRELTMERPNRVVVGAPDTSLLLTRPLREDPPDVHPNITFTNTLDPDYQLIRAWIADGAKQN